MISHLGVKQRMHKTVKLLVESTDGEGVHRHSQEANRCIQKLLNPVVCPSLREAARRAPTETNLRRLVDVGVVAGYLDVAPDTIYTMVSQRRIPFVKVGRLLKFDLSAIDGWIRRNSVMPMPEKRG